MKAINTITQLPDSKNEIKAYEADIVDLILSGDVDPLLIHKNMKVFETILKNVLKNEKVKTEVLNEADKHGKTFDAHNCTFTVSERAVLSYNEDEDWQSMQNDIDAIKTQQKAREVLIKAATNKGECIPDANGEAVNPVSKKSTTVLTCKIK